MNNWSDLDPMAGAEVMAQLDNLQRGSRSLAGGSGGSSPGPIGCGCEGCGCLLVLLVTAVLLALLFGF